MDGNLLEKIIEEFGEEKIIGRYKNIYEQVESFINAENLKDAVIINENLLNQALLDYFVDIYRLKQMHPIKYVNANKIHSYLGYWLLRRKPIQLTKEKCDSEEMVFINEEFIASYLIRYLYEESQAEMLQNYPEVNDFISNLKYSLRYRNVTQQSLESILEAFFQEKNFMYNC